MAEGLLRLWIWLRMRLAREEGQGLTEYGLIIALVAALVVGAILAFGKEIGKVFHHMTQCLGVGTSATSTTSSTPAC
jgi:pilus assembly protein Flp/PilA